MTPEALLWIAIVLKFATGLTLIGLGVYGHRLRRITRRARRSDEANRVADAQVAAWRAERRSRRESELRAWDRDFAALLPRPEPVPCDGSEHAHIDDYRIGSREVRVICVPNRVPGFGITAVEAVEALQRLATPQRMVMLSPGERVLSPAEIQSICNRI